MNSKIKILFNFNIAVKFLLLSLIKKNALQFEIII